MPFSFVLGSKQSSTYPKGYASGFDSPAAKLDDRFDKPAYDGACVDSMRLSASYKSECLKV